MSDTTPATLTVLGVERVAGAGRLIALAVVEVEVGGIPFLLQDVKIVRRPDGVVAHQSASFLNLTQRNEISG